MHVHRIKLGMGLGELLQVGKGGEHHLNSQRNDLGRIMYGWF